MFPVVLSLLIFPQEYLDEAKQYREKLVETAVEMDDEVMERYLNGDEITDEEVERCLRDRCMGT